MGDGGGGGGGQSETGLLVGDSAKRKAGREASRGILARGVPLSPHFSLGSRSFFSFHGLSFRPICPTKRPVHSQAKILETEKSFGSVQVYETSSYKVPTVALAGLVRSALAHFSPASLTAKAAYWASFTSPSITNR